MSASTAASTSAWLISSAGLVAAAARRLGVRDALLAVLREALEPRVGVLAEDGVDLARRRRCPPGPAAEAATPTAASPAWIVPCGVSEPGGTTTSACVSKACSPAATSVPAAIAWGKAVQLKSTTVPVAGSIDRRTRRWR